MAQPPYVLRCRLPTHGARNILILLCFAGASAIAYASLVTLIFSVRYLDVLRWAFKLTWMVLGITIAAEVAGKALLNNGFATQLRPRKYYTIPRETLEAVIGDVHELINFFVIESQRVLFAENVYASAAVSGLHNRLHNPIKLPQLPCRMSQRSKLTRCRLHSPPFSHTTSSRSSHTGVSPSSAPLSSFSPRSSTLPTRSSLTTS